MKSLVLLWLNQPGSSVQLFLKRFPLGSFCSGSGPLTSCIDIIWELVRDAESRALSKRIESKAHVMRSADILMSWDWSVGHQWCPFPSSGWCVVIWILTNGQVLSRHFRPVKWLALYLSSFALLLPASHSHSPLLLRAASIVLQACHGTLWAHTQPSPGSHLSPLA